ncbi:permease [Phycicoccus endophyticus]|uniref:Permease n=1 Tax=Phycicoccus endophyticus TaxID=1690220 RepID=A0A7G9QZB6_9MICO|nr:permease [Phycicoccus endophyticus]NHI19046.1 hypothetical protein [Phycicoccus endophyticus]QNN48691.1 permease [Phycicoccus endophyticus]GGL32446.1 hypothetical protein GCM10012283_13440 [Phycicoccus endophyticus]
MLGETWWFVRFTLEAVLELLPWFLVAIVLGVLVQHLDLDVLAKRALSRHGVLGVVLSAAVGALSPFCSFTVIPLVARLLRAGVPLSVIMAFWVASPAMDPEIFALSAAALGTDVATARLLGAVALSVGAGFLVLVAERRGRLRDVLVRSSEGAATGRPPLTPGTGCAASSAAPPDDARPWPVVLRTNARAIDGGRFARDVVRDLTGLGRWLLLAVLAQAVIVRHVPQEWVTSSLGTTAWWAVPLAALVGVPLYLNGVGAIPVAAGLLSHGMTAGAAVTFLLAGAVTTVPAMVAVRAVVRWRAFAVYLGVGLVGSTLVGLAVRPLL